jgi:CBS domain-containing protein
MGNLSEIMSSPVITILPTKTVVDAAQLMTEKNIESLVVSWGTDAVGILTEKDIVRRVVAKELPYSTQILEMMSKPVITINVNAYVEDAINMMVRRVVAKELPYSTQILEMMSKPVITINVNTYVEDAINMMKDNGVKRLPVEEKGTIIGIIAASDLAHLMR